jgi:hypothetical protein
MTIRSVFHPVQIFSVFLVCLMLAANVMAQIYKGPVSKALGGTSAAGPESHDSLFTNPALASYAEEMDAGFFYSNDKLREKQSESSFGIQMIDNSQNLVLAGGLAYLQKNVHAPSTASYDEKTWMIGGARPLFRLWSVGASFSRTEYFFADRSFKQYDANIGALYVPRNSLSFGYVLQNFTRAGGEVPEELRLPLQHVLGFNYLWQEFFRVRLDLRYQTERNPDHQWIIHSGIESSLGSFFVLRLGGLWDEVGKKAIGSMGIGFLGPRLRVNYAYQWLNDGEQAHSVDIRLPL